MDLVNVGKWSFVVGLMLAILAGSLTIPYLPYVMIGLGLIVGFLNITKKEIQTYLIATIAMLVIGMAILITLENLDQTFADWLGKILTNFIVFVSASGLVVAIKSVVALGED